MYIFVTGRYTELVHHFTELVFAILCTGAQVWQNFHRHQMLSSRSKTMPLKGGLSQDILQTGGWEA